MIEFADILDEKRALREIWKEIAGQSKGRFRQKSWGTLKGYIISPNENILNNKFLIEEAVRGGNTSLGVVLQPHPSSSYHPLLEHETNPVAALLIKGNTGLAWLRGEISLDKASRGLYLQSHRPTAVLVIIVGKNREGQVGYHKYHVTKGPLGWEVNFKASRTPLRRWKISLSFTNVAAGSEKPGKLKGIQVNREAQRILNTYVARKFGDSPVKELSLRVYPSSETSKNIARIGLSVKLEGTPYPTVFHRVNEFMNYGVELAKSPENLRWIALKITNYEPEEWLGKDKR